MNGRLMIGFSLAAVVALTLGSVAQAGLNGTPILNPSFESVENGGTPGGWGYIIDDWYENEQPEYWANFYEKGADIGLAGDGLLWAGFETGGANYQDVGTVDDNMTYTVSSLIGARWGTSFNTGAYSLYAGGSTADAADGIDLSTFATELDSVQVSVADGTPVSTDVYEVSVNLSTGTGHAGETLWLQFSSVDGKDYFDNISINAIPEPATATLFGIAMVAIGAFVIRRQHG